EMNPRVSRTRARASKATGFPIAKIAAKLAVGYTLEELPNDITRETPASFEPSIDYVVIKVPRFTFEKFPAATSVLGIQMKSVGEAMSIGRTFRESFQKVLRSLETGRIGFTDASILPTKEAALAATREPRADRIFSVYQALKAGCTVEEVASISKMDPWFLEQCLLLVQEETVISEQKPLTWSASRFEEVKKLGFSDAHLSRLTQSPEAEIRKKRHELGVIAKYGLVDTCAGEFEARTPYYYSNWEGACEATFDSGKKKIVVLGGGPNRIGQGIEFDYCCVHASLALREAGYETIMVNSNPETVSTDYDTSDRLFFEPLTIEDVLSICHRVKPDGVIVQFGGQTPLKLSRALAASGVPIIGTSVNAIHACEDREEFKTLIDRLGLKQPPSGMASSFEQASAIAQRIGFPVLARPSYVLGGRGMRIVYSVEELETYIMKATDVTPESPVLVDKFLEDATEIDVDAICDGKNVVIAGIMEHIEEAGIHSGDSTAVLPAFSIPKAQLDEIRRQAKAIALEVGVVGLMNVQFAIFKDEVYVLEVNPRASRTIPFVSKAIGHPLAKYAALLMVGKSLKDVGFENEIIPEHTSVKEPVFPFTRFDKVDILLGPEMLSTGEVMGIDKHFGLALAKAKAGAMTALPKDGAVLLSVKDHDKPKAVELARSLVTSGLSVIATGGTAQALRSAGIEVREVQKIDQGRPNVLDVITNSEVKLVINTPSGISAREDEVRIRRGAILKNIPVITTMSGAEAAVMAIAALVREEPSVRSLQEYIGA
ncbi:MAG: carbamoyl-phosphate synthase large subunit, partial [Planctomycetota bacterium]